MKQKEKDFRMRVFIAFTIVGMTLALVAGYIFPSPWGIVLMLLSFIPMFFLKMKVRCADDDPRRIK